jgi:hypothetical protein
MRIKTLHDDRYCIGCETDLTGAAIPEDSLHFYNHGPDGELIHSAEEYAAVRERIVGGLTHFSQVIGVEYSHGSPQRYDGVSEYMCPSCGRREGRWTGKVLAEGEEELRFGGKS